MAVRDPHHFFKKGGLFIDFHATPISNRTHIALFGRCNAGKSSLINALVGQDFAIVSTQKGTTTDPVYKTMELLPLGPVVMIDTPGLDDESDLGQLRMEKALRILDKTDIVLIVEDARDYSKHSEFLQTLVIRIKQKKIPYLIVWNKIDLLADLDESLPIPTLSIGNASTVVQMAVSAQKNTGIDALKQRISTMIPASSSGSLLDGIVNAGDLVILVVPIDSSAPKGRLILPQQQVLRNILDLQATALIVQPDQLSEALGLLSQPPRIVITDSQAFEKVFSLVPEAIPLTSFSILFARHKGSLQQLVHGMRALATLCEHDSVLISEGCTHHRQCDDIGTVKIPRWLQTYTKKQLLINTVSGAEFPTDLHGYQLLIHCGGCMLNEKEMKHRMALAEKQQVPMINYGIFIACVAGNLQRALAPFAEELFGLLPDSSASY